MCSGEMLEPEYKGKLGSRRRWPDALSKLLFQQQVEADNLVSLDDICTAAQQTVVLPDYDNAGAVAGGEIDDDMGAE